MRKMRIFSNEEGATVGIDGSQTVSCGKTVWPRSYYVFSELPFQPSDASS